MKILENCKKHRFLVVIDLLSNLEVGGTVSHPLEVVEGVGPYQHEKKNWGTPGLTFERYCSY